MLNQIGSYDRQSIGLPLRPTIFDRQVAALDIAGFGQALIKSSNQVAPGVSSAVAAFVGARESPILAAYGHGRVVRHAYASRAAGREDCSRQARCAHPPATP